MFDLLIFDLSSRRGRGLGGFGEIEAVRERLRPGRFAVFYWPLDRAWRAGPSLESDLVRVLCGDMDNRGGEAVEFFVNMGVRIFSRRSSAAVEEIFVMVFRKSGESLRARRLEGGAHVERSRLDTGDFAFTRDLANNVWHLYRGGGVRRQLVSRFARLLTWDDERVGVWDGARWRAEHSARLALRTDLVPVPEKYHYGFAQEEAANGPKQRRLL